MASPEAGSVVERLREQLDPGWIRSGFEGDWLQLSRWDAEALLAVVEAAKIHAWDCPSERCQLRLALDALHTPDSAESKDAEGAKP